MSDMLARIKNRSQRPTVQRDTSLTAQEKDNSAPATEPPNFNGETVQALSPLNQQPIMELEEQLDQMPKVAQRRNIRLEESIDEAMQDLCNQEDITIETFLEACYLVCDRSPEFKAAVLQEATERLQQRKEAGKLRRLYSQLKKMGQV